MDHRDGMSAAWVWIIKSSFLENYGSGGDLVVKSPDFMVTIIFLTSLLGAPSLATSWTGAMLQRDTLCVSHLALSTS